MEKTAMMEEAMAMKGVQFSYVLYDGSTIESFVKAFDPAIGLTCYSLQTTAELGYTDVTGWADADGTFCVIAFDFKQRPVDIELALNVLAEIAATGKFMVPKDDCGIGMPSCSF